MTNARAPESKNVENAEPDNACPRPPAVPHPPSSRSDEPAPPSQTVRVTVLVAVALATLAAVGVVARRVWPIGISGQWQWKYYEAPGPWILALPAVILSLLLALTLVLALQRRARAVALQALTVAVVLGLCLALILSLADTGGLLNYETVYVTAFPWTGGYYPQSIEIREDIRTYLGKYPDLMESWPIKGHRYGHLADHPVGPVLFHWAVNRLLESSPALTRAFTPRDPRARNALHLHAERCAGLAISQAQFAGIFLSALLFRLGAWLALIPIYFLARDLHSHEVGLLAVALSAVIPSLNIFAPYPDQLLTLFAVGAFYTWYLALRNRNMAWSALSALIMLLGLQFSLSLLTAGAVMAFASLIILWKELKSRHRLDWRAWLRVGLAWVATFLVLSLLPMVFFGYDVWRVWSICLAKHATFAVEFNRSYRSWVLFNPVEFLLFTGLPISLLMIYAAVADVRRCRSSDRPRVPAVLPWALIAAWLLLNLSGKSLGEGARLWMFMMPFAAVSAAAALAQLDREKGWTAAAMLLLCSIQMIVFRLNLFVFGV